jgi:hypothetical protein
MIILSYVARADLVVYIGMVWHTLGLAKQCTSDL